MKLLPHGENIRLDCLAKYNHLVVPIICGMFSIVLMLQTRRATSGSFVAFASLEYLKHISFDIRKNFQRKKMQFYILIIYRKSYQTLFCPTG